MAETRLQLAQRLRRECAMNGTGPTSTVGQVGEYQLLIDWLDDAYRRLQSDKENWQFLRKPCSLPIVSGTATYTPEDMGITDHARWIVDDVRCYLDSKGVVDEQEVYFIEWEIFKRTYLFGSSQLQTGRPIQFTVKPDESLMFWPIPDDSYIVSGEYYMRPVDWSTAADPDTEYPVFPERFHMILVWSALMFYGANYSETDKYAHGQNEYKELYSTLKLDQLPRMTWGQPLT